MTMNLREFCDTLQQRRNELPGVQRCAECNTPLQETVTGNRFTHKGHVCSDCYFNMLGEELDRNPLFMPRAVRGA